MQTPSLANLPGSLNRTAGGNVGFYMTLRSAGASGKLLGIVIDGTKVHTGDNDSHVAAVRSLMQKAKLGAPSTHSVTVRDRFESYVYTLSFEPGAPSFSISRNGRDVLPLMVGSWEHVNPNM